MSAPCCDRFYPCRFCHDAAENHAIDRTKVNQMRCCSCETVGAPEQVCRGCQTELSASYCGICHVWTEDAIFHCDDCGLCRVGKREDFRHCHTCMMCLPESIYEGHQCVLNMNEGQTCSICLSEENLRESREGTSLLGCGHVFHRSCLVEWLKRSQRCPLCRAPTNYESVLAELERLVEREDWVTLKRIHCVYHLVQSNQTPWSEIAQVSGNQYLVIYLGTEMTQTHYDRIFTESVRAHISTASLIEPPEEEEQEEDGSYSDAEEEDSSYSDIEEEDSSDSDIE